MISQRHKNTEYYHAEHYHQEDQGERSLRLMKGCDYTNTLAQSNITDLKYDGAVSGAVLAHTTTLFREETELEAQS